MITFIPQTFLHNSSIMGKVLLVTDYSGNLHITPVGNKDHYRSRNAVVKTQQYGLKEMDEDEANAFVKKNKGIDPSFKTPAQSSKVIEEKDARIAELEAQLNQLKNGGGSKTIPEKAEDLIAKINAAATEEDLNKIILQGETRSTVIAAWDKRALELKK